MRSWCRGPSATLSCTPVTPQQTWKNRASQSAQSRGYRVTTGVQIRGQSLVSSQAPGRRPPGAARAGLLRASGVDWRREKATSYPATPPPPKPTARWVFQFRPAASSEPTSACKSRKSQRRGATAQRGTGWGRRWERLAVPAARQHPGSDLYPGDGTTPAP